MQKNSTSYKRLFVGVDLLLIIISFGFGAYISTANIGFKIDSYEIFLVSWLLVSWIIITQFSNIYSETRNRGPLSEILSVSFNTLLLVTVTIIILFFLFKDHALSRRFIVTFSGLFYFLMILKLFTFQRYLEKEKARNVLILGSNITGMNFYRELVLNSGFGFRLKGFLAEDKDDTDVPKMLGTIKDLEEVLEANEIKDVVIALSENSKYNPKDLIDKCENYSVRIHIIPDISYIKQSYNFSLIRSFPIISIRPTPLDRIYNRALKRIMDIGITLLLFITIFWWLWPILALMVKLDSKGPVLYKQARWGLFNKSITCYKFRSMYINSSDFDPEGRFNQASKNDPRVTRIGRFLRKTNLDELPQFWNVLLGNMSLVGPRPHAIGHNKQLKGEIQKYMQRHLAKPGITGWAQVSGYRGEVKDISLMERRVECDIWYIEYWTPLLDIRIFLKTIYLLFKGDRNAY